MKQETEKNRTHWPIKLDWFLHPSESFLASLVTLGLISGLLLFVIAAAALGSLLFDLTSGEQKRVSEATKTALPLLAGIIGLPLIIWRLRILDRQTRISDQKTQIDRETHYTSIFSRSIDQLGQTRELKSTKETEGVIEAVTRTVPNIEVRLGGIHSLSRLAEESARDRQKIENVLRSYIRENSWSDRNNQILEKVDWPFHSAYSWAFAEVFGDSTEEFEQKKSIWLRKIDAQRKLLKAWAERSRETRVDVNEALDTLNTLLQLPRIEPRATIYECFFVNRKFGRHLLAGLQFERCIFIRCSFDAADVGDLKIEESQIVLCEFTSVRLQVAFIDCKMSQVTFLKTQEADIAFVRCEGYEVKILDSFKKLNVFRSTLYKFTSYGGSLSDDEAVSELIFDRNVLIDAELSKLVLSSLSKIDPISFTNVKMNGMNLTNVTNFSEESLSSIDATPRTQEPRAIDRPFSWPAYDAAYDPDDIPF